MIKLLSKLAFKFNLRRYIKAVLEGSVGGPVACNTCKLAVTYAQSMLEANATRVEILDEMKGLCNLIPSTGGEVGGSLTTSNCPTLIILRLFLLPLLLLLPLLITPPPLPSSPPPPPPPSPPHLTPPSPCASSLCIHPKHKSCSGFSDLNSSACSQRPS